MNTPLALSPDAQDLLFRDARTANAFSDEPVTDDQIAAIYDLVKYAPTAMNAQPLRIVIVRQGAARERLLKHVADGNRDKTANAPVAAVPPSNRFPCSSVASARLLTFGSAVRFATKSSTQALGSPPNSRAPVKVM